MIRYSTEIDVELDIDELLDRCSDTDIDDIIEWLRFQGHISDEDTAEPMEDTDWNNQVIKLVDAQHLLTSEEEELILSITKKLI